MERVPRASAATRGDFAMIPHFPFRLMEDISNLLISAVQLGLDKTKDVSTDGFHLIENVQNIGAAAG